MRVWRFFWRGAVRAADYAQRIAFVAALACLPGVAYAAEGVTYEPWWVPLLIAVSSLALGAYREYAPLTPSTTDDTLVAVMSNYLTPAKIRTLARLLDPNDTSAEGTTLPGASL